MFLSAVEPRDIMSAMVIRVGRTSILLLLPFFISACSSSPRGVVVLCAGDSLTAEAYPHLLQQILNRTGLRVKVLNYGRNGNTSGEYLRFLESRLEKLKAERPDFILLQLGTNDVRTDADNTPTDVFKSNMKAIVAHFRGFQNRAGKPSRILLGMIPPVPETTPLPFTPASSRRVEEEINPAIRALAGEDRLLLVDNHVIFTARPEFLPGVHPTRDGYRLLAENWHAALRPFLAQ
jgi:lysophospholipase L1-like esterase